MAKFEIDNILNLEKLNSELELEQANALYSRLRPMAKDDPFVKNVRSHLANLIEAYEEKHWANEKSITGEQIDASELAERIVAAQNRFVQERKKLIRSKLKKYELTQNDLADILGHRKNYMSELINGVRPFAKDDIVIIHRIFEIPLNKLVDSTIKESVAVRLRNVISKLNKPKFKLKDEDICLS